MRLDTLEDLYLDQLKDIHSANTQALKITAALAAAATDHGLVEALKAGAEGIEQGIDALQMIATRHDERPDGEHCKGMEGLAQEARAHALDQDFGDDATRDAMIITQYQRLVHYALAGYGCLVAFAERLELREDVTALRTCLDKTYDGDRTMTELASGGINKDAMA